MRKSNTFYILLVLFGALWPEQVHGQLETFPGFVIHSADSSASLSISPRLRISYVGASDENRTFESDVSTPLARVGLIGQAFNRWRFFIQAIFAPAEIQTIGNELEGIGAKAMLDGRLEYLLSKSTRISFGQEFLPGNWEGTNGLLFTTFTDRSLVSKAFWLSRDIGVQLKHYGEIDGVPVRFYIALSKGEGLNVLSENEGGWQYTVRLSAAILGKDEGQFTYIYSDMTRSPTHRLWLSSSFTHNNDAIRQNGNTGKVIKNDMGDYLNANVNKWFVDISYKYYGFAFLWGYSHQRTSDLELLYNNGNGQVVQGSYLLANGIEFALQYGKINGTRNSPLQTRDQFSVGINKYFRGQGLKWMNEVNFGGSDTDTFYLRSMLQLIL